MADPAALLKELDRLEGGSTAADLLRKLDEVEGGKTDEDVLTDAFGSPEAAVHAMTGEQAPEREEFFLNPETGQMTSRELLRNQFKDVEGYGPMMASHGGTLGMSDEAAGVAGLIRGALPDGLKDAAGIPRGGQGSATDQAKFEMEKQRAWLEAVREKHPWTSLLWEMAGGMVVPASIYKEGARARTWGQSIKQGAKAGGVSGGLYAAGEAEGNILERARDVPLGVAAGTAGGAAAVPVGKAVVWAGKTLGKPVARIFADRRYYHEATGLTQPGKDALRAIGVDPDEVSASFARHFSEGVEEGIDPKTAAAAAEMSEFGIPAMRHNVTGNPTDFADFERARRGGAGEAAASRVGQAAEEQFDASVKAADDVATSIGGGTRGDQLDAATAVTNRLDEIKASEKAAAQAAYDAAEAAGVKVDPDVAQGIVQRLETRLANEEVDLTSDIFAKSRAYMSRLAQRGQGEEGVPLKLIDTFRKDLNRTMGRADSDDLRALTIIKNEYDQWVDDVVSAKLFEGDAAGFEELKNARALWAAYSQKYMGKDAGSKFIRDMIDRDASPEQVVKWMFGSSRLGGGRMNSKLAGTLRDTLGVDSNEWNMVRQAAFRQMAQKPGTEDIASQGIIRWGPQKVSQNISTFLDSPSTKPLANALFSSEEQAQMRRFASALKRMVPPDGAVNYSNTAYELSRMGQKAFEGLMTTLGFTKGGPAGAIAGREGAKAMSGGASWLKGRALTAPLAGEKSIGAPAVGAIGGAAATNQLFQGQPR